MELGDWPTAIGGLAEVGVVAGVGKGRSRSCGKGRGGRSQSCGKRGQRWELWVTRSML